MVQLFIGGNPHGRVSERKRERTEEHIFHIAESDLVDAEAVPHTFFETLDDLKRVVSVELIKGKVFDPETDQLRLYADNGELLLSQPVRVILGILRVGNRDREIYEWRKHLERGWTGALRPEGGQLLATLLGLPVTIGNTEYVPVTKEEVSVTG